MEYKNISLLSLNIKQGSEKHFRFFFDETHAMVFNVCLKMGLSQEDAEEIVQDAYIQFWKQRQLINENDGVLGLLKLIAKRLVIKKINKKELLISNNIEDMSNLSGNSESEIKTVNSRLIIENIEKLPFSQKQIITLFYFEGLTTIEIADHMKVSIRTIENHLYRGKKKLKQILKKDNLDSNSFYEFFNE